MRNKMIILFIVTMLLSGSGGWAANSFSDISSSNWAYQAVVNLAEAGIIDGYPDGTFRGTHNLTRYEMAQMVGKALAHEGAVNAEQRAVINRLSDEFSDELVTLGVRVSALEEKVGNVKLTGDMRLRVRGSKEEGFVKKNQKSLFDYRARIQMQAKVNENMIITARLRSGAVGDHEFGDASVSDIAFDRMNAVQQLGGKMNVTAGRYGVVIGEGLIYNDEPFDGLGVNYKVGSTEFSINHGKLTSYYAFSYPNTRMAWTKIQNGSKGLNAKENPSVTIMQARLGVAKNIRLDGYYILGNNNLGFDIYGVSGDVKIFNKWGLGGEYVKATNIDSSLEKSLQDTNAWVLGIGYGVYNMAKPGSWDIKLQRFVEGKNAPIFTSRWAQGKTRDFKGWLTTIDYAVTKNIGFAAYYGFNNKHTSSDEEYGDYYRAELNFKF